jgi:hypothetical protein
MPLGRMMLDSFLLRRCIYSYRYSYPPIHKIPASSKTIREVAINNIFSSPSKPRIFPSGFNLNLVCREVPPRLPLQTSSSCPEMPHTCTPPSRPANTIKSSLIPSRAITPPPSNFPYSLDKASSIWSGDISSWTCATWTSPRLSNSLADPFDALVKELFGPCKCFHFIPNDL